jgi:hypothetical protein
MSIKTRYENATAEHAMLVVLIALSGLFLIEPLVQNYSLDARIFPQSTAAVVFLGSVLLLAQNYLPGPVYTFVAESVSVTSATDAADEGSTDDDEESTDERTPRLGEEYGIEINDTIFMVITSILYLALGWAAGFLFMTFPFVLLYTLWFRIPVYVGIGLALLATVVIWFFMTFLILPFDQGTIFDFSPFLPFVTDQMTVAVERAVETRVI